MTRNLEFSIGEYYHLYSRGIDKRVTFLDSKDYERFTALLYLANNTEHIHISNRRQGETLQVLLGISRDQTLVDIGAYCLMPNHFHILVREKIENGISMFMQKIITAYTMYFNKKYQRTGGLFAGPFKAVHVNNDEHLKYLLSYIHLNPIKIIEPNWKESGIKNIRTAQVFLENYSHMSYADYCGITREANAILNRFVFPDYFTGIREFTEFVQNWLTFSRQGETLPL